MTDLDLPLALFGGVVLALSLGAEFLRSRSYLPSELMIATGVGVLIGPLGLDAFHLADSGPPMRLIEEGSRLTVAIAVTSIAMRLPERYVRDRARSLTLLIAAGMTAMWLVSSALVSLLVAVPVEVALLVGAIVTPTDPVIATSIVEGQTAEQNLPGRLRYLLIAEAGLNDGVAYLFVFFALFLLGHADGGSTAAWLASTVGYDLLGAVAVGLVAGLVTGRTERALSTRGDLDETSVFTVAIALTFLVLGLAAALGTDDILAAFVAGLAYNWQADPSDERREQTVEEVFNRLFTLPIFVVFGATVPWREWAALGWQGPALVAGVLLLRRLPMVAALRWGIAPIERPADVLFVGWFGPIGVAALFYAAVAVREAGVDAAWTLGSLVVAGSILAHGATASAATHRYGDLDE